MLDEAQLTAIDVAQAGNRALVEQRVSDSNVRARRLTQRGQGGIKIDVVAREIRPKAAQARVKVNRSGVHQLDRRRVEADRDPI